MRTIYIQTKNKERKVYMYILSSTKFFFGVSIFCLIMTFISAIGFLLVPNSVNFLDGLIYYSFLGIGFFMGAMAKGLGE